MPSPFSGSRHSYSINKESSSDSENGLRNGGSSATRNSLENSHTTNSGDNNRETALDGGWGWVVITSVVIINVINFGHFRCFGLYVLHLMNTFDADASEVAWIISIQVGFANLLGPFGSSLIHVMGPRKVGLIGGFVTGLSFALASLAPNLMVVYFTYGVGGAVGLACTFAPSLHMIGIYFCKRRGIANGLCMAGNSLGGMVIPPVMELLLEEFGYRGTILIMGGVLFNSCACVMFWHPSAWHQRSTCNSMSFGEIHESTSPADHRTKDDAPALVRFARRFSATSASSPHLVRALGKRLSQDYKATCPPGLVTVQGIASADWDSLPKDNDTKKSPPSANDPTKRKIVDFGLLRQPMFWVLMVSNTCSLAAYPMVLLFLPLRFRELGYTQTDVASVLSILALSDLFGRVVVAGVTDWTPLWPRSHWFTAGYLMTSAVMFVLPHCSTYTSIAVTIGGFGVFSGTFIALTFSRVSDIFGGERVAMIWGLLSLCGGLCGLGGPPLLGYLMDKTGSYMVCQSTVAAIFLLGALACFGEPILNKMQEGQKKDPNAIVQVN